MNKEEMEQKIEELENKIEELQMSGGDSQTDLEEDRDLYLYMRYKGGEVESLFGLISQYRYFILEESQEYTIPSESVCNFMSTTTQAVELVKLYSDVWEEVELIGSTDDAVFYVANIPEEEVDHIEEGYWVSRQKFVELIQDFEIENHIPD